MLGIGNDQNEAVETVIGSGTTLDGSLDVEESIRIDGTFEGTINCAGTLIIGPGADVQAEIIAEETIIGGRVDGNITAHERIEMRTTGEIYGDLTAPELHIEKGVVLKGSCTINTGEESEAKVTSIKEKLG